MRNTGFIFLVMLLAVANIYCGSVNIPLSAVTDVLCGREVERQSWHYIIWENRIPQTLTAIFSGAGLAAAGLLLQTVFRNPLAGPSILGIDGGANLGVALVVLLFGGTFAAGTFSLSGFVLVIVAAMLGAWAIMAILIAFSHFLRSNTMLLITGVMISYLTSSLISLLNYGATEEGVRSFMVWGLGSFSNVTVDRLPAFVATMRQLCHKPRHRRAPHTHAAPLRHRTPHRYLYSFLRTHSLRRAGRASYSTHASPHLRPSPAPACHYVHRSQPNPVV